MDAVKALKTRHRAGLEYQPEPPRFRKALFKDKVRSDELANAGQPGQSIVLGESDLDDLELTSDESDSD